uniref:Glycerophosphocholine phosphodiesterase GPCPD1 n=1 Tax=Rhabditophanes sp. KR3021 TaxID=114890 RepID=A0AC35UHU5_9BILA
MTSLKTITIKAKHPTIKKWETLFIVGDVDELGNWDVKNGLPLTQSDDLWELQINLPLDCHFRFFTAYQLYSETREDKKILIISQWEALQNHRTFKEYEIYQFGASNPQISVNLGWLTNKEECEVHLRVHGEALHFFRQQYKDKEFRIKVTPFDLRYKEIDHDSAQINLPNLPTFSITELAVISIPSSDFQQQHDSGVSFTNSKDYLTFKTTTSSFENVAFRFDFFTSNNAILTRSATAIFMPSNYTESLGETLIPILTPSQWPIGQIKIDYFLIRSIRESDQTQNMGNTLVRTWPKEKAVEVGHRGMGDSFTKEATVRENTIRSFNQAGKNGADYVEFDVQLTKDKQAIIYHDFHVKVCVAKKHGDFLDTTNILSRNSSSTSLNSISNFTKPEKEPENTDYHTLAVKDLKLKQLQLLHLDHINNSANNIKLNIPLTEYIDEDNDQKPFPLLSECLQKVIEEIGFNIEIKYPLPMNDGTHECKHYFERNLFIDVILEEIFEFAGKRRIIFSSFDADMCTLIAKKQNKYPVLLLCVGETKRYLPFKDIRQGTSEMAINFAKASKILGVNFHSEDLLRDPEIKERADKLGLVSFAWGNDLDKYETVKHFINVLKIDGLIYDRIGENEHRCGKFVVARESRKALMNRSTTPTVSRNPSLEKCSSDSPKALTLNIDKSL